MLAACLVAPAPMSAQPRAALPGAEAEVELAGYADCVVSRKAYREPVARFLRVIPGSDGFGDAGRKAADLTCLNAAATRRGAVLTMRLQPATFRGALFPALYRRDYRKAGPVSGIATSPPLSLAAEFDGDAATIPPEYVAGRTLGDCVVRAAVQPSHDLMLSKPGSPEEDAAVTQIAPALEGCVTQGQTVRFNRIALRSYVGESLYKLSAAAQRPAP